MNDLTPVVEKIIRNFNHELKNPLTTIKGYAQLLGSKANDPQFVEKSRNIIIENVDDIDSKMNRMYDIFNLPGGERDAINPGEIIEEFVSSRNESEKRFLLLENINSALQATGDQNYLRRIIDVLFYGFDWINHQDSRLKISFGDNDSTGATIAFCFDNADFSHLAETNFYLPFSEKRYFNTGIELFEVFFLSYLSGWELTFSSTIDYRFLLYLK